MPRSSLLARLPSPARRRSATWLAARLAGNRNNRMAVVRRKLELCFPELLPE